jgi:hypothetical protein
VFAIYSFSLMESAWAYRLGPAHTGLGRHFPRTTVINLESSPHFVFLSSEASVATACG